MLLRLLKYSITLIYIPGSKMYIADFLSRFHLPDKVEDDPVMVDIQLKNTL